MKERQAVFEKYNQRCSYCGKSLEYKDMQVDHMTPRCSAHHYGSKISKEYYKLRGDNVESFENKMPSCRRCNHYKRSGTVDEFRNLITTLHERLMKIYIVKVAVDFGIITIEPYNSFFYFEEVENFRKENNE